MNWRQGNAAWLLTRRQVTPVASNGQDLPQPDAGLFNHFARQLSIGDPATDGHVPVLLCTPGAVRTGAQNPSLRAAEGGVAISSWVVDVCSHEGRHARWSPIAMLPDFQEGSSGDLAVRY